MVSTKSIVTQIYNYLASDSTLLSLMGLGTATEVQKQKYILKVRQPTDLADRNMKICIWHGTPSPINQLEERRMVVVDVLLPLELQKSTGIGFDVAEEISSILDKKPIGMGLKRAPIQYDLPASYGWYKASVPFIYNFITK